MNTTPRRLGKYELVERLGHGGIAEVWKALDIQLQRFVAIKLLQPNLRDDPQFMSRFQAEARMIASLHHPNIVQIHDFQVYQPTEDEPGNTPIAYMVMDYVEGQTLAGYIRETSNKGKFPTPTELVNLFTSISLAIDYAHKHSMIHRDIKPANILLDRRNTTTNPMGEPILTDFGVAKLLNTTNMTLTGAQLGTPLYISPEQANGYPGNERSDLYALGVILYEIATGVMPFRGDTPHDVIMQHVHATPPTPDQINPRIPPALTHVIMRSLAKDPALRYPSAPAMTIAIAEALRVPIPESLNTLPASQTGIFSVPTALISPMPQPTSSQAPAAQGTTGEGTPAGTPQFTPVLMQDTPGWAAAPPAGGAPPASLSPQQPPVPRKRRSRLTIALVACLVVLLLASGVGAFLYLPRSIAAPTGVTGNAYYLSSGQLNPDTAQGIADQMQIDLQNVPAPRPDNNYYVWLLGDKNPVSHDDLVGPRPFQPPVLLTDNLPVHNGVVNYFYDGTNTQHNDLISTTSRLLITEQPAGQSKQGPPTDHSTWRYYAEIPQDQIPGDSPGFSALIHIRHMFYDETHIRVLGLKGGLDFWLSHNAEKIVELSASARDNWHGSNTTSENIGLMNDLYVRILDYLDGANNVHVDLPPNTPVLTDPLSSKIALLTVAPEQKVQANFYYDPFGYVDHSILHVGQVGKATDITPQMRQLTTQIVDALQNAGVLLQDVRQDAIKLYQMRNNPSQIQQDSTGALLDDMTTKALYAYIGQVNPNTNQVQPAILQAHYNVQRLATLTIGTNVPAQL